MSESRGWIYTGLSIAGGMIAAITLFVWREYAVVGHVGFPLDDSWIHLQMARNLSLGQGMYFNGGDPVSASSAPLWTLLLAALHLLPADTILAVKVSSVVLLWAAGLVTAAAGRSLGLSPIWAAAAGMALTLSPRMVWGGLSGMEIPLYTLLATAGVWLHIRSFGAVLRGGRRRCSPVLRWRHSGVIIASTCCCSPVSWPRPSASIWLPSAGCWQIRITPRLAILDCLEHCMERIIYRCLRHWATIAYSN